MQELNVRFDFGRKKSNKKKPDDHSGLGRFIFLAQQQVCCEWSVVVETDG